MHFFKRRHALIACFVDQWIVYCIMTFYYMRAADPKHTREFALKHPIGSLVSALLIAYGGSTCLALACGESIALLQNDTQTLIAIVSWGALFFSPNDLVFTMINTIKPLKFALVLVKETNRAQKTYLGALHVIEMFPQSTWVAPVIAGTLKAGGGTIMTVLIRLIQGLPVKSPFNPVPSTLRMAFFGSILSTLSLHGVVNLNEVETVTVSALFMVVVYLSNWLFHTDPFTPISCAFIRLINVVALLGTSPATPRTTDPPPTPDLPPSTRSRSRFRSTQPHVDSPKPRRSKSKTD